MKNSKSFQKKIKALLKKEFIRRDSWEFCLHYDYDFFSNRPFLKAIAYTYQFLIEKENTPEEIKHYVFNNPFVYFKRDNIDIIEKASVSMSPRSGKSYTASVCNAWALGRFPKESIMRNACTATLYDKFSYDTRDVVKSEKFKEIFDTRLSRDKSNISGWNTNQSKQVGYFGAGVGGTIIGFGASLIAVTDDLYRSKDDALSKVISEKIWSWYDGTHKSRLEGDCPELDLGTRWCEEDVMGRNEDREYYDVIIRIPALVKNDKGEDVSFCEHVKSTRKYLQLREDTEKFIWEAEYMQAPSKPEGLLFNPSDLNYYNGAEFNKSKAKYKINATDFALGGTDHFASIFAYIIDDKIYIDDVLFNHNENNVDLIIGKLNNEQFQYSYIESNSAGKVICANMISKLKFTTMYPKFSSVNKTTRIREASPFIKKLFVFRNDMPKNSEYGKFMSQLTKYLLTDTKDDDAPDVCAMLNYLVMVKNLT